MSMTFTASAPGSLMLLGEHAVLHGRLALVCAINHRIRATLTPRKDTLLNLISPLGKFSTDLKAMAPSQPFRFVLAAIARQAEHLSFGFDLNIESDISDQIGFGSSAAVTVATTAALATARGRALEPEELFRTSLLAIRDVQGIGSGADAAASVYGGIVAFRSQPLEIQRLAHTHPLTAVYSGSKKPTVEVIRLVEARRHEFPHMYEQIFDLMDQSTVNAVEAILYGNWKTLGTLMNFNQGLMDAVGVNNAELSAIVYALRNDPGILGAKISGSGLGDCAIGLGALQSSDFAFSAIPVTMAEEGLIIE
jgi:mevalonate kinase